MKYVSVKGAALSGEQTPDDQLFLFLFQRAIDFPNLFLSSEISGLCCGIRRSMKRHAPCNELSGSPHAAPSQRQHTAVPRAQHSSGRIYFNGNPDFLSADEALSSKAAKVEWMWQLERDAIAPSAAFSPIPSRDEVVARNSTRPYFHGHTAPGSSNSEEQARREPSAQPHERDMEIGYEDDRPSLTLGSLEQKFLDETMHLVKEQNNAADVEYNRHRQKIIEINGQYRDKLLSLRAQQANRRKDFLLRERREHRAPHQEVPPAGPVPRMTFQSQDAREMERIPRHREVAPVAPASNMTFQAQVHRDIEPIPFASASRELLSRSSYSSGFHDLYRDRAYNPSSRGAQTQETEERVPLPAGRVYNTSSRYQ